MEKQEYTFTVKKKQFIDTSILDELINEVKKERAELDLTYEINSKTTSLHAKVLKEFRVQLNKQVRKLKVKLDPVKEEVYNSSNKYFVSTFDISLDESLQSCERKFFIKIAGISDNNFKGSKYITYTGAYKISIQEGHYQNTYSKSRNKDIESIEDVILFMRDSLKQQILVHQKTLLNE